MKRIFVIIAGIAMLAVSSCSKKPDTGGTATEGMANEWWAELIEDDGVTNYWGAGAFGHIMTYNSAANTSEIWIDDPNELWNFKVKAGADLNAKTFSATNQTSVIGSPITVTITEGKIIPNGGHSKTGNITDSIYFKVKFSDDPMTFTIRGHARTRFSEDDYH